MTDHQGQSAMSRRTVWVGYVLPALESIPKRGVHDLQAFATEEKAKRWRDEWAELIADGRLPHGISRQIVELEIPDA